MPLRAIIDKSEVISSFLSPTEWKLLKEKIKNDSLEVIIAQTKKKGFLRTSKNGLQHFVHKKGELPEDWKPESPQHLYVKNQILLGCQKAGWTALPEYSENQWIADILASKGNNRVAFEVQWSPQSFDKTIERQERYKSDNVRGCWFFKNPPKEIRDRDNKPVAIKDVPLFKIIETKNKEIKIDFNNQLFEIKNFVLFLLIGKIKFCSTMRSLKKQIISINFYEKKCWKCGADQHSYYLSETVRSICGKEIYLESVLWEDNAIEFNPEIQNAIRDFIKTEKGKNLKIGQIKKRYSKTAGDSYMSFGCYNCDAIFGGWYNHKEVMESKLYGADFILNVEIVLPAIIEDNDHWCISNSGLFCE